jgi:hypothetical protein
MDIFLNIGSSVAVTFRIEPFSLSKIGVDSVNDFTCIDMVERFERFSE